MKIGLSGVVTGFRLTDIKGLKVGQFDLMQHGDSRFPTKVYVITVLSNDMTRVIMETLERGSHPWVVLYCHLDLVSKDNAIELLEIISIKHEGGESDE